MAPTAFAALAAEMPEFDPEAAPGSEGENDGMEAFPSLRDEPKPYNVLATGKPNTLAEAFEVLMFPTEFHDPFFNLVGAYADAPAEVIAALPFGTYREAVANHLVLEDGRSASLFEQGRFYKFFKDLVKLLAPCPTPPSSSSSVPLVLDMTLNCPGCDGLPMFVVLTTSTSNSHHGAAPVVVGLGWIVSDLRSYYSAPSWGIPSHTRLVIFFFGRHSAPAFGYSPP